MADRARALILGARRRAPNGSAMHVSRFARSLGAALLLAPPLLATDLEVTAVALIPAGGAGPPRLSCSVRWSNAFRDSINYDGAWLFAKVKGGDGRWRHARILESGHRADAALALEVADDRAGILLCPATEHAGPIVASLDLALDAASLPAPAAGAALEVRAYGIEMVYVPAGPFHVGEPDPRGAEFAAFFRSDAEGRAAGTYLVAGEGAIRVAPEDGALWYPVGGAHASYGGDHGGPVPPAFPKGHAAFWCMKYELAQGEYAAFLNSLRPEAASFRAVHAFPGYAEDRGTLALEGGAYGAAQPRRPLNFVSWDDGCGFADWAALRPMTELEFTKAARGPAAPLPNAYPWGTTDKSALVRVVEAGGDLAAAGAAGEERLSRATLAEFGASHYRVLDLAGSAWEKCVTLGHPLGRAFRGTHGDGETAFGFATNSDWPKGDAGAGGFGYRGGGFYAHGYDAGEFNPWSPVEWRRFGSWGEGPRSRAYGFRAVRTAPTAASRARERARGAEGHLRTELARVAAAAGAPGAAAAVFAGGSLVASAAVGLAEVEQRTPASAATRFGLGSISKPITAAALLRTAAIDLDQPVEAWLAEFPHRGRGVTCARIAGHVAGLDDAWANELYQSTEHFATTAAALERALAAPLRAEPGTAFEYATGSYTVLAAVLEAATGAAYGDAVRGAVLAPLGLADTVLNDPSSLVAARTGFYVRGADGRVAPARAFDPSHKWAGAGFLATAEDAARFGAGLLRDDFLPPERRARLFAAQVLADGTETGYGLGFFVGTDAAGRRVADCPGGGPGIGSHLRVYPDHGVAIAVLSNLTGAPVSSVADAVAEEFLALAGN